MRVQNDVNLTDNQIQVEQFKPETDCPRACYTQQQVQVDMEGETVWYTTGVFFFLFHLMPLKCEFSFIGNKGKISNRYTFCAIKTMMSQIDGLCSSTLLKQF